MSESPKQILDFVALGMDRELREVFELIRERLQEICRRENRSAIRSRMIRRRVINFKSSRARLTRPVLA
jgi:hypothetical protein